ncbi:MAG: microviridin/marinostatin family tricyclic proteinase inhibitor [Cystobacter sp.]
MKDTTKKPFFARLLEDQELDQATGGATPPKYTQKYPSDGDENVAFATPPKKTQKYPSDGDDHGGV